MNSQQKAEGYANHFDFFPQDCEEFIDELSVKNLMQQDCNNIAYFSKLDHRRHFRNY